MDCFHLLCFPMVLLRGMQLMLLISFKLKKKSYLFGSPKGINLRDCKSLNVISSDILVHIISFYLYFILFYLYITPHFFIKRVVWHSFLRFFLTRTISQDKINAICAELLAELFGAADHCRFLDSVPTFYLESILS